MKRGFSSRNILCLSKNFYNILFCEKRSCNLFLFFFCHSSPAAAFSYKLKLGISLGSKSWTKRETRQTLNVPRTTQCLKWKHSSSPFLFSLEKFFLKVTSNLSKHSSSSSLILPDMCIVQHQKMIYFPQPICKWLQ